MKYLLEFMQNEIMWTAVLSWFVAQLLKVVFVFAEDRKLNFKRLVGSGGMPSSHSAFTVSLAMSVGFCEGFSSAAFAICFFVCINSF